MPLPHPIDGKEVFLAAILEELQGLRDRAEVHHQELLAALSGNRGAAAEQVELREPALVLARKRK